MQSNTKSITHLLAAAGTLDEVLTLGLQQLEGPAVFSTSFSKEDQLILEAISRLRLPVHVFTLDTGRLFPETYRLWTESLSHFGLPIIPYYPDSAELEEMVSAAGPDLFYRSIEDRQRCCTVRKVHPLKRALQGKKLWLTGIRAAHSPNRSTLEMLEYDEAHALHKLHPLLHWSDQQVDEELQRLSIPCNALYDKGFLSIGCAPCTRAVSAGEDARAGRWWWEEEGKKECGLHQRNNRPMV